MGYCFPHCFMQGGGGFVPGPLEPEIFLAEPITAIGWGWERLRLVMALG